MRRPSRAVRAVIRDYRPYLRFYYRFLAPHAAAIEQGRVKRATVPALRPSARFHRKHAHLEELCRDRVDIVARWRNCPCRNGTGSFWSKQAQVDVVAVNWRSKEILLGECKWGQQDVGATVQALPTRQPK
ncbi:MAG: hypothetical protein IPH82_29815 [Chloroflexi bacterium]|nr:hypothetical protein [Chloroflexota bacterium]